ncbi:MAG: hypothetical protein WD294_12320 [Phycisphaeraceae bacterium]
MQELDDYITGNEKVVRVTETVDGTNRVFYCVYDSELDYWRSTSDIEDWDAWTRDVTRRCKYPIRGAAEAELAHVRAMRQLNIEADEADYPILDQPSDITERHRRSVHADNFELPAVDQPLLEEVA